MGSGPFGSRLDASILFDLLVGLGLVPSCEWVRPNPTSPARLQESFEVPHPNLIGSLAIRIGICCREDLASTLRFFGLFSAGSLGRSWGLRVCLSSPARRRHPHGSHHGIYTARRSGECVVFCRHQRCIVDLLHNVRNTRSALPIRIIFFLGNNPGTSTEQRGRRNISYSNQLTL